MLRSSTKKTRILVLNYEFPPLGGGASPVSYEVAHRLSKTGEYDIDVITMGFKDLPSYELINPNFRIHRVKAWRKRKEICQPWEQAIYLVRGYFKARMLLKKQKYDISHCHFIIPTGVLAFVLKFQYHLRYVISVHGSDVPGYNPDRFVFLHRFTKPLLQLICNHAEKILPSSNFLKKLIKNNIGEYNDKTLFSVPNAIDLKKFPPLLKRKMILSTGRLLPRKGFHHLIQAVSDLDVNYELHIIGDGPMMSNLRKLAKKSKVKVVFHGWLDNNSESYQRLLGQASLFCLVSERENASVALLEAMSAGCAVITSNDTGCSEMVGGAGVRVPFGDIATLKREISKIIKNNKHMKALQQKSRERATDIFSWDVVLQKYAVIFGKIGAR